MYLPQAPSIMLGSAVHRAKPHKGHHVPKPEAKLVGCFMKCSFLKDLRSNHWCQQQINFLVMLVFKAENKGVRLIKMFMSS
jgi:hypothetical protein